MLFRSYNIGYAGSHPFRMFVEKTTGRRRDIPKSTLRLMALGSAAEPVIREWFADETGMQVIAPPEDRRLIHFHHEHGCIGATLDGAVIKGGEPVIFEAKRVTWSQAGDWKDGAPRKHRVQAQHQMLATGLNACYIVGMINDKIGRAHV